MHPLIRPLARPVPAWLARLTPESIRHGPLPMRELLDDSLYYPGGGSDGDPVKHLGGLVHSFVYVDYSVTEGEFTAGQDFVGYRILGSRRLTPGDLNAGSWRVVEAPRESDITYPYCLPYITGMTPEGTRLTPHARWNVYERVPKRGDDHGPERFSLLFFCAEGCAAFQALYGSARAKPLVLALILTDRGFGHNWTRFEDPTMLLARTVARVSGMPEYLLHFAKLECEEACWPAYHGGTMLELPGRRYEPGYALRLWRRAHAPGIDVQL